jgi:hypothetical protein
MITNKKYDFVGCSAACFPGGLACVQNTVEKNYLAKSLWNGTVGYVIGLSYHAAETY